MDFSWVGFQWAYQEAHVCSLSFTDSVSEIINYLPSLNRALLQRYIHKIFQLTVCVFKSSCSREEHHWPPVVPHSVVDALAAAVDPHRSALGRCSGSVSDGRLSFSCCLKAPGSPWCPAACICTCRPTPGTQCGLCNGHRGIDLTNLETIDDILRHLNTYLSVWVSIQLISLGLINKYIF